MGTYTTNYNLFMPSIGEQGWGELVNNNFTILDTTLKGLDTRIETLETEMDAVEERVTTMEAGEFEGNVSATLFSGNLNGSILSTATIVSSEPYINFNVTVLTMPSFTASGGASYTIAAIPSNVILPWGTYTVNRPKVSVTYTVTFRQNTGSVTIGFTYNGTKVFEKYFTSSSKTGTFTIEVDTSQNNTLSYTGGSSSWNCNVIPSLNYLYLKTN